MNSDDTPEIPVVLPHRSDEVSIEPAIVDDVGDNPPPRLGIIHFLAWITITAALYGIDRSVSMLGDASPSASTFYRFIQFFRVVTMAAGIVGVSALTRWRATAQPGPLSPGHWILAIDTTAAVIKYGLVMILNVLPVSYKIHGLLVPQTAVYCVAEFAQIFLYFRAARYFAAERGWRRILKLLAFRSVVGTAAWMFVILQSLLRLQGEAPFLVVFGVIAFVFAAIYVALPFIIAFFGFFDARRKNRDWLHNLGISMVLIYSILFLVSAISPWLIRR